MVVEAQAHASVPLATAYARIANWLCVGGLDAPALTALGEGQAQLMRAGLAGITKEVSIRALDPIFTNDHVVIPIRWIATGPAGEMFPALDANLELHPVGSSDTEIRIVGSYTPPFGHVGNVADRILLQHLARGTVQRFVNQTAHLAATVPGSSASAVPVP